MREVGDTRWERVTSQGNPIPAQKPGWGNEGVCKAGACSAHTEGASAMDEVPANRRFTTRGSQAGDSQGVEFCE